MALGLLYKLRKLEWGGMLDRDLILVLPSLSYIAGLCYFVGSSLFHPSPPLFFYLYNPLTLYRRGKRIEERGKSLNKVRSRKGQR